MRQHEKKEQYRSDLVPGPDPCGPGAARDGTAAERRAACPPLPFPLGLNAPDLVAVMSTQLDRLGLALFVLGEDDEILAANLAARRLCDLQDAFSEFGGRFVLLRRGDTERWLRLKRSGRTALLNLPRATGRRSYLLLVSPVAMPSDPAQTLTCLTVLDPHCAAEADLEALLRSSLELSASESRVVASLAEGRSVREAADHLSLSHHTVRSHLKRIFTRCEVHSQAELMQLVGRVAQFGCPSIGAKEVADTRAWRQHPGRHRARLREKD
ncbi:MAG TPA: helix-turn-helix transcriptional regulator [Steroidobacteraceae bacterium]|nr:helix-turn-helix transcriptional regulator [Steroidobacteraceae bacterium]